ncbi:hypothetical protein HY224_01695, partial [Candidatus Uhrbacteria bacterium]|nr:hypothetical protein [Candidatus Uhrbacteria bacterium]
YRLPQDLAAKIKAQGYSLLFQKQAGTPGTKLNLNLKFDSKIKDVAPAELVTGRDSSNQVRLSTDLTVDREFSVKF